MGLREQIEEIVGIARLTDDALRSVDIGDVRLDCLAEAVRACPDLMCAIEGAAPKTAPVMRDVSDVSLPELQMLSRKIKSTALAMDAAVQDFCDGELTVNVALESIDALHKLVALLPGGGGVKVEASTESPEEVAELERLRDLTRTHRFDYAKMAEELSEVPFESAAERGNRVHRDIQRLIEAFPQGIPEGYEQLAWVFSGALSQAAFGKGKERHANGQAFHEQRMQTISDMVGSPDGMAYQAAKKMVEALQFDDPRKRQHELLGAVNYLAGIIIWLRRHESARLAAEEV